MSTENKKLTKCSACDAEIAKNAKSCPQCGSKVKKPLYKKWWFIAIVAIVLIAVIANSGGDENTTNTETNNMATQQEQKEEITYTAYEVSELMTDLEGNALKAENKYNNQYVEITGKLANIDSDGKYISLHNPNEMFSIIGVQCYIKNDEQKAQVAEMSKDDIVTVKGKIKSVGEVLGYTLDIDAIVQ